MLHKGCKLSKNQEKTHSLSSSSNFYCSTFSSAGRTYNHGPVGQKLGIRTPPSSIMIYLTDSLSGLIVIVSSLFNNQIRLKIVVLNY